MLADSLWIKLSPSASMHQINRITLYDFSQNLVQSIFANMYRDNYILIYMWRKHFNKFTRRSKGVFTGQLLNICRTENCFRLQLQKQKKNPFYAQYIFSVRPAVIGIIKQADIMWIYGLQYTFPIKTNTEFRSLLNHISFIFNVVFYYNMVVFI
jgi:hypothetical protein